MNAFKPKGRQINTIVCINRLRTLVTTAFDIKPLAFVCGLSIVLLTACAPPRLAPEVPFENKQPMNDLQPASGAKTSRKASSLSSWEVSGAMAARNKSKGWTASVNWVQQGPNQYQLRLFGPLGGGAILIEKNGGIVTYTDGPKKLSSHNADELLQQQTGIRLPVHDLYYWVRGLPAPGAVQSATYDTKNHLESFSQAGYSITYPSYLSVSNVDLPSKIQLQGHGVVIKLIIKHWTI